MFLEKYKKLIEAACIANGDDAWLEEEINFIDDGIRTFPHYMQKVCDHVLGSKRAYTMYEAGRISREQLLYRIESADEARRVAHEKAMSKMDQINRRCDFYHVEHLCPDDPDRHVRANFCAEVTTELFMLGTNRTIDEIEKQRALFHGEDKAVDSLVDRGKKDDKIDSTINFRKSLKDEKLEL